MAILGPFHFRGGLSLGYDFPTFPQDQGYANLMQNCYIKGGCVVPRWHQTQLNTATLGSGHEVGGLIVWNDTVNSVKTVVATCNTKIYTSADIASYLPQTDSSSTTITFTDRTGAITIADTARYTFDFLNNILVGAGASSVAAAVFKVTAWNANAAVLGGTPPNADCVKQVNNFLFLSRNLSSTTTRSKVYWSNVNDPETWTAANVLEFRKNDGEPVMALGSIGTDLYIFKQNSIGRLSTVTITTSGAVTLGPLVTVIQGTGCCGPLAIDNLPNGNIVFIGTDGHFYEFDGSTVLDRSKQPYPGPNVFDQSYWASNSAQYQGMVSCTADITTVVKTVRGNNEVWISFTASSFSNGFMTFIYNFASNRWYDNDTSSSYTNTALWEVPISSVVTTLYPRESTSYVLMGSNAGIIISSGDSIIPFPKTSSGTTLTGRLGTIVQLAMPNGDPFIPRSLCLELNCPTTTTGSTLATFSISIGYDRSDTPTSIYSSTATTVPNRIIAAIPFIQDSSGTNIFPKFMTIQITFTGTGTGSTLNAFPDLLRIGQFWVSDEVCR